MYPPPRSLLLAQTAAISVECSVRICVANRFGDLDDRSRIDVGIGQFHPTWGCTTADRTCPDESRHGNRIECISGCWADQEHRCREYMQSETITNTSDRRSSQHPDTVRTIDPVARDQYREVQALGVHQSVRMALPCIDNQSSICKHDAGMHS